MNSSTMRQHKLISMFLTFLFISILGMLLNGCSSYPQARYYNAKVGADPAKESLIPFALQGCLITIAPKQNEKAKETQTKDENKKQPENELSALGLTPAQQGVVQNISQLKLVAQVFATQMDASDSLYYLESHDSLLTKSNISVSYYDGRHTIKTIGTEFQDDRIKVIEAIGGTVTSLMPLIFTGFAPSETTENLSLPLVLDFTSPKMFRDRTTYSKWDNIPNYTTWWYRYKISQPEGRIFATEDYFENQRKGKFTREFPISACVDMNLEIGQGKDENQAEKAKETYTLRVPDPLFVEPLPFPVKGSITMHTICGADITTQPSQAINTFAVIEAVSKQVNAIWQAQKNNTKADAQKDKK